MLTIMELVMSFTLGITNLSGDAQKELIFGIDALPIMKFKLTGA